MNKHLQIKDNVVISPRPALTHETLITAVIKGAKESESFKDLHSSVAKLFALDFCSIWEYDKDEYLMAKEMESKGYTVNLQFVNDITKFRSHIDEAQHDSEMLWATKYKSELSLLVGSTFDMEFDGKMHSITIETLLNRAPAQYGVVLDNLPDDDNRRIITLEEALKQLNNSNRTVGQTTKTSTLCNKDGAAIPPRPEYSDELITTAVKAELEKGRIFRTTLAKNPSDDTIVKLAKDFAEVWHDGVDAYDVAKELESKGYIVNTQCIDDIELLDGVIFSAHTKATNEWFETHQPIPPFQIGARLMIENHQRFEPDYGTIEEIYSSRPATYAVIIDGTPEGKNTRRLIDFEDATLALDNTNNNE